MKQEKIEDIREKMRKMRKMRERERVRERRRGKKRKENINQSFFHTLFTLRSGTTISNFSPELLRLELEKCQ